MKKVLIVTFHFPPYQGSSGVLRSLKFVKYLRNFKINPIVLAPHPRVYDSVNNNLIAQIPDQVQVKRTFALDSKKHFSIRGKYFAFTGLPDQFVSWSFSAVIFGFFQIFLKKIDAIFTTYPIATTHLIGLCLHLLTRKPWLADFRDPMWDEFIPLSPNKLKIRKIIEKAVIKFASHITVTTESMRILLLNRYKNLVPSKISVIMNGYDEDDIINIIKKPRTKNNKVRLIHAGLLEMVDRNPLPFFDAIKKLVSQGKINKTDIVIDFYATGDNEYYTSQIKRRFLDGCINIHTAIPYDSILNEMADSNILLLFQGPTCDNVIPAKLFEYFTINRPIFALSTNEGETGKIINSTKSGEIVPIDNIDAIAEKLILWIDYIKKNKPLISTRNEDILQYSRFEQTGILSECFNTIIKS